MNMEVKTYTNKDEQFYPTPKSLMEPYHDVTVYEDGYEDWYYIGD